MSERIEFFWLKELNFFLKKTRLKEMNVLLDITQRNWTFFILSKIKLKELNLTFLLEVSLRDFSFFLTWLKYLNLYFTRLKELNPSSLNRDSNTWTLISWNFWWRKEVDSLFLEYDATELNRFNFWIRPTELNPIFYRIRLTELNPFFGSTTHRIRTYSSMWREVLNRFLNKKYDAKNWNLFFFETWRKKFEPFFSDSKTWFFEWLKELNFFFQMRVKKMNFFSYERYRRTEPFLFCL